ncbi:ULK3 [Mytilus edulis]|uniref:Serine/threonine-protein kinase ULK3 n=1 Tax=Mytilus edulis TaxID=6550 RepID=A0A8S3S362_MYTED|nr:ULK3 [Mytilus edulis]
MLYLREHNVAHMDLKPQNVLLTSSSNPTVKIADFGFAKHMFDGDKESVMKGSPLYMAPEIICQKTYDARVDLWSIGVILYECLFGRAPFASKSFQELGAKIWNDKPVELPYGVNVDDEELQAALKVIKAAEIEESNEEYEKALTHYELGLKTVITYLKEDSNSRRKKLLSKQAQVWMSEAEKIKSFLDVSHLNTNDTSGQEEMEENEHLQTGTCNLQ